MGRGVERQESAIKIQVMLASIVDVIALIYRRVLMRGVVGWKREIREGEKGQVEKGKGER